MEIVLNLKSLKQKSLTPNQVVLLKLLYDKNFDDIKEIFGIKEAIAIRDSLIGSKYILNPEGSLVKFTETVINELELKLKDPKHIFINLLSKCLKNQYYFPSNSEFIIFQYTSILIYILRSFKEKFDICFIIMSALYNA